jgi:hypothetical protein
MSRDELDQAFEGLERELPDRLVRSLRWLRDPKSRWIRLPLGLLFIAAGLLWFLPVVGIEFLPVGLLLIAEDVPFLRKPVGRLVIWLEDRWLVLKRWWRTRRSGQSAPKSRGS